MTWKQMFETNRSLLMTEVSTNDAIKLTKWAIQALLGGVKHLRLAYASRKKLDDNKRHDLFGMSRLTTAELQSLVNLNFDCAWGALKVVLKTLVEQPDGSYFLVKDPNRFVIRLYKKVPIHAEEFGP